MKSRLLLFALVAVALLEFEGCATSRVGEAPWPMLDSTLQLEPLAIDGLWRTSDQTDPTVYRLDAGYMYLHSEFGSEGRFGMLRYRGIEQTGPRNFACEKLLRSEGQNRWVKCQFSLEADGSLVEESEALPELGFEASGNRFYPVEPDDPVWFRVQSGSSALVSKAQAHHPADQIQSPHGASVEVPVLPPPPPPTEIVQPVPRRTSPFGPYHALVIGVSDYLYLPAVATAEGDADAVSSLLEERYGFEVTNLRNPRKGEVMNALAQLHEDLSARDSLLIYYSGHGWLSEVDGHCSWFPVDALEDDASNWIANREITERLKLIKAKHIMVVADSCYTDGQRREVGLRENGGGQQDHASDKQTRVVLSSGSLEPVQAGDGGEHSVFTRAFLKVLKDNQAVLDSISLFSQIQDIVSPGAIQTPEYAELREAEHEGGDFLFVTAP